jgi:ABC-2 type transport system ATP-binding protein
MLEEKEMVKANNLSKTYFIHEKEPGLRGSLKSLFTKKYKPREAVKGVTFSLTEGEMVGFLGANGAGKTTTLKMLSGVLYPTDGEARVAGFIPAQRKQEFLCTISLVMGHKQQLTWDLSAYDSFLIHKVIYKISDRDYKQRIGDLSEMLSVDESLLKRPVRHLSLGERMKCELIAALLHRPRVLFLDEPTIGLDINAQRAIRQFLARYNDRYKATVLLTSHHMSDITELTKRVICISKGAIIYDGSLRELGERAARSKTLNLQLVEPLVPDAFSRYGEVKRADGLEVVLSVAKESAQDVVIDLFHNFQIADIRIEDEPIEEIIGRILARGDSYELDAQKEGQFQPL